MEFTSNKSFRNIAMSPEEQAAPISVSARFRTVRLLQIIVDITMGGTLLRLTRR